MKQYHGSTRLDGHKENNEVAIAEAYGEVGPQDAPFNHGDSRSTNKALAGSVRWLTCSGRNRPRL